MPKFSATRPITRRIAAGALSAVAAAAGLAAVPTASVAKSSQIAIIQDGGDLTSPDATLAEFRALGANTVRVIVNWNDVLSDAQHTGKTKPKGFDATNPNDYPDAGWAPYDNVVRAAATYGMRVDFTVTGGAPRWAEGSGIPKEGLNEPNFAWKPNATDFGQFMQAVGERYDGSFKPHGSGSALPAVHFWVIYNEPNFGQDLGPQAIKGSTVSVAPMMYRSIVDSGWKALQAHHKHDTILIGEFAARGENPSRPTKSAPQGFPGNYGQTRPLQFIRTLYCVGTNYKPLTGNSAKRVGCPATKAATRGFRRAHPGLFSATGVGDHPYPGNGTPVTDGREKDFATFPELGNLESTLDKVNKAYGSSTKYPIYNDEYGYITNPPNKQRRPRYVSPATAAYYINWAEYLSWKSPRVASYMQYLLQDPAPTTGPYSGFASGLEFFGGQHKPGYDAYRLPIYMPKTSFSKSTNAELWGAARPAPFMARDGAQSVSIQLNGKTIKTMPVNRAGGYFDVKMKFPSSGTVQLAYTYPTSDSLLPMSDLGTTVYSRSFKINVH